MPEVPMTEVLSPEGAAGRPADARARRLPALAGHVVALHDNAKPGAGHLLAVVGDALGAAGAQLRAWHKAHAARPSPHIPEMARAADAAVFALGD